MKNTNRRNFIKSGVVGGAFGLLAGYAEAGDSTPTEIEGPFYPVLPQKDKDFDLTKIDGRKGIAKGKIIFIHGQVLDTDGKPIEDATVDLWQANAAGRYRHPHDSNKAPLDPDFQGWAIVRSGKEGKFCFKTIYPGSYPASPGWQRPPHIHYQVSKKGYIELLTQMYFPGHELNGPDLLLKRKNKAERKMMIASQVQGDPVTYEYNIVLRKANA